MTDEQIAAVAKGLSEAQVNLLFFWPKGLFDQGTCKALQRKGLIDGSVVTPNGLQVRRYLQEQG